MEHQHPTKRDQLYRALRIVFADVFDEDVELQDDMTSKDVDGWDSLSHIRLVLTVERAFGVRFATSEVDRLKNVGELVSLILSKQSRP
jgi:acyl carrier protein